MTLSEHKEIPPSPGLRRASSSRTPGEGRGEGSCKTGSLILLILFLIFAPLTKANEPFVKPYESDSTYQWSIPVPDQTEQRVYLWIPPDCPRVRGVIVGLQNMLEKPLFQDVTFRQAAKDCNLAIAWMSPGSVGKVDPALSIRFQSPKDGYKQLADLLTSLAKESGYTEIENAPLLVIGHSAASPFVWGMPHVAPARVFAIIPYKGYYMGKTPDDLPILHLSSEWAEVGGPNWGTTWAKKDMPSLLKLRALSDHSLMGECPEIGNGHYDYDPLSTQIVAMFIRKAVDRRIPTDAPLDAPIQLKPISPESGVLVDATKLGTPDFKAIPYDKYDGDKSKAYWYFDDEIANAINDFVKAPLAKKPQAIDFLVDGKPFSLEKQGTAEIHPTFLDDGASFRVQATFLDQAPPNLGYTDTALSHVSSPILFKIGSGALEQTGPDTFRVHIDRGGVVRQGPPWEPWVIAYNPGDATLRSADRPMHIWVNMQLKDGKPQTLDFPKIDNVKSDTKSIPLLAKSDSGLPIQYFVVSGPVKINGDSLEIQPIPPRTKFPIRVLISAFQWGRATDPKFQSAGPIQQEFFIER
jgi:hypothetical protein